MSSSFSALKNTPFDSPAECLSVSRWEEAGSVDAWGRPTYRGPVVAVSIGLLDVATRHIRDVHGNGNYFRGSGNVGKWFVNKKMSIDIKFKAKQRIITGYVQWQSCIRPYTHCCLTETNTVMNCGTDATNSLLLPMTTNETLFTDNYTKTPTNTLSSLYHPYCSIASCQFTINEYVMLCYVGRMVWISDIHACIRLNIMSSNDVSWVWVRSLMNSTSLHQPIATSTLTTFRTFGTWRQPAVITLVYL